MATLPPAPFDFETEVLVSGALEISAEKLARGLSWLAASLKEQNVVLSTLCTKLDSQETPSSQSQSRRQPGVQEKLSMKDEMMAMQVNSLKHEVSALRANDLERQRERIMAEVQSISTSLSDRQRESNERLQRELAEATDSLCLQLGRIDDNVSARLQILEGQLAPGAQAAEPAQLTVSGSLEHSLAVQRDESAEDTEDQTDGPLAEAMSTSHLASAELDRLSNRVEALERRLGDLTGAIEAGASSREVAGREGEESESARLSQKMESLDEACRKSEEMFAIKEEENRELRDLISSLQKSIAALVEDVNSLRAPSEEAKELESGEGSDRAAEMQATAVGETETIAMRESGATGMSESAKDEPALCAEQGESLEVPKDDCVAKAADTKLSDRVCHLESSLQKLEQLMGTTESKLRLAAEVPECQQSILRLQKSIAELSQHVQDTEAKAPCRGGASASAEEVTATDSVVAAGVSNAVVTREAAALGGVEHSEGKAEVLKAESVVELSELVARVKCLEDLHENATTRLNDLENYKASEAPRKALEESREGSAKESSTKTDGIGGSWKDVQAELEYFRKLFEFIEGVLPQDASNAMKFFSRRQLGQEVMSEMVSGIFGPDIEFQNATLRLQHEFKTQTRELRREFDKLSLAMKALQRDIEGSDGKLLDLTKRTGTLEEEVRSGRIRIEDPDTEPSPGALRPVENARDDTGGPEISRAIQELRDEVKQWLERFKASVIQALQAKPDNDQVVDFIKQVAAPSSESIALFAKRQLLGKCASCEAPIDVDLMRVKRPQPIGLQDPWPPGDNLGARVAIRPLNVPSSPSSSRLPKIERSKKGMRPSASTPELRKEVQETL